MRIKSASLVEAGILILFGASLNAVLERYLGAPTRPSIALAVPVDSVPQPELVLEYYGSSLCGACTNSAFKTAMKGLMNLVETTSREEGVGSYLLGVSTGPELRRELEYLSSLGAWHEVSLAGSWWNTLAEPVFFREAPVPATPTVKLYWRTVRRFEGGTDVISSAEPLLIVGTEAILAATGREALESVIPSRSAASE